MGLQAAFELRTSYFVFRHASESTIVTAETTFSVTAGAYELHLSAQLLPDASSVTINGALYDVLTGKQVPLATLLFARVFEPVLLPFLGRKVDPILTTQAVVQALVSKAYDWLKSWNSFVYFDAQYDWHELPAHYVDYMNVALYRPSQQLGCDAYQVRWAEPGVVPQRSAVLEFCFVFKQLKGAVRFLLRPSAEAWLPDDFAAVVVTRAAAWLVAHANDS